MQAEEEALYQQELNAYKSQIEILKGANKESDERNRLLLQKVRDLQELLEKANVAHSDLYTAFEHIRQENLRLQDSSKQEEGGDSEMVVDTVKEGFIQLAQESMGWEANQEKLRQQIRFLERERERFAKDNATLGKQVQCLIRTLEEERGMIIRNQETSADPLDEHLITFRSIQELQQKNQKLLSLVNFLTKEAEEREGVVDNEEVKRLNEEIKSLKGELDSLREDRERVLEGFNLISRERELFKILLCKTRQVEHMTPEIFQRMVSIACSSLPMVASSSLQSPPSSKSMVPAGSGELAPADYDAHIKDLISCRTRLEEELNEARENFAKLQERTNQEISLKTELLREAQAKIVALTEKNRVLETNAEAFTTSFEDARANIQKLKFDNEELNKKIEQMKGDANQEQAVTARIDQLSGFLTGFLDQKLNQDLEEMKRLRNLEKSARLKSSRRSQAKIAVLTEKNRILEANIQSLKNSNSDAKAFIQKLKFENLELNKQIVQLRGNMNQERAVTARIDQLSGLLTGFIDQKLNQPQEPQTVPALTEPEPQAVPAPLEPEPQAVAASPEPEPQAVPASPEPEPQAVLASPEPEPQAVPASPEPEPQVVLASPEPEPQAVPASPEPESQQVIVVSEPVLHIEPTVPAPAEQELHIAPAPTEPELAKVTAAPEPVQHSEQAVPASAKQEPQAVPAPAKPEPQKVAAAPQPPVLHIELKRRHVS